MVESAYAAEHLLAAARAGSEAALGVLLQSCRNYLLLIAEQEFDRELHARGGASDLVQETFLEAKQDFSRFRGTSEAELLAWLRQILLHNIASFTRNQHAAKRQVSREVANTADESGAAGVQKVADPGRTPSSRAIEREQTAALYRALEQLPADYRQAIVLRCLENRSFEEIASRMNRSTDAVRKLWSRAMKRLQQEWEGPK
jgi:RNA polymerase sigma-70 factor (ECF subfamily)